MGTFRKIGREGRKIGSEVQYAIGPLHHVHDTLVTLIEREFHFICPRYLEIGIRSAWSGLNCSNFSVSDLLKARVAGKELFLKM